MNESNIPAFLRRRRKAAGRTKVWMASLMWSMPTILSASTSIANSTTSSPIIHGFSSVSHGELNAIKSVKRASSATVNSGTYAFNPADVDSPNAVKILEIASIIFHLLAAL